jgi:hypothetical protein
MIDQFAPTTTRIIMLLSSWTPMDIGSRHIATNRKLTVRMLAEQTSPPYRLPGAGAFLDQHVL